MPKVSQEYRDARRTQILAAAKRCFLRDGFYETSMQDLFAEFGLFSGVVYRYFAGKEDMILAIVEENMRDVAEVIHALVADRQSAGVGTALAEILQVVRDKHVESELGAIAVLVWSEALRNPAVGKRFEAMFGEIRADLAGLVREHQSRDGLPSGVDADAFTSLLMAIVPGFILQLAMFGHQSVDGVPDAARALWPA
jgi:AcrR family transcriptional regulator